MLQDLAVLSFKNLSQRRLRSWLTMIGIFIGIAAVVSLIGLGEGLRVAITAQFGFLGTDVLSVQASGLNYGPPGSGVVEPLEKDLIDKIESVRGVESVFGRRLETALISINDFTFTGYVVSIPESNRKEMETLLNLKTEKGRLLEDSDDRAVVMGYNFLESADNEDGLNVGDDVTIAGTEMEVIGFMEKKGSFIFDNSVIMNDDAMDAVFGRSDYTDVIAIKVENEDNIEQVQEDVERLLRKERGVKEGDENFQVQTPQKALESLNDTLFAVQLFVYIIAFISLVVGGIGIMNTMYTAVLERTPEIGIMKAIGARNSMIFTLFFFESGLLGMVGGIIGILAGASFAYGLAAIGRMFMGEGLIQVSLSPLLIGGALLFSFMLGTIFGLLPAYRAAQLQPVEALRQ